MKKSRMPVLFFQMIAVSMLMTSIGLSVPYLSKEVGLSLAMRSNVISAQFFGSTIFLLIGGALCDKFGRSFVTRLFLLFSVFSALFFTVAWNAPSAMLATFLVGAMTITIENGISATCLDMGEKSRWANMMIQTSFSVGAILVPVLFYFFLGSGLWRPIYYIIAAASFIGFLLAPGKFKVLHSHGISEMFKCYLSFFKKPTNLIAPIGLMLYVGSEVGLWAFVPTIFEAAGYGPLSGIISTLLIWVMILIGRIVGIMFVKKLSMIKLLILSCIGGAIACFAIFLTKGMLSIAFISIAGFFCGPIYSLLTSLAIETSGNSSTSYLSFTMAFGSLGSTLIGFAIGLTAQYIGTQYVMLLPFANFVLLLALICAFSKSHLSKEKVY